MPYTPLISVIIPAYNSAAYISDAIASVLNQTYQEIDLIVVDDGSTDGTLEEIKNFKDSRLRYFTIVNSGQCAAANYGLSLAKGEYIKFLDADDLMNKDHIAAMLKAAIENEGDLILCKWARFYHSVEDAKFGIRPEWSSFDNSIDWFKAALSAGPDMLPVWQWLIPKRIIEISGGWDESLGLGNDFEFSSRLLMASKGVSFCEAASVYYRSGLNSNMSTDVSPKTFMSVLNAIHKSAKVILSETSDAEVRDAFATKYFSWLITYYPFLDAAIVKAVEAKIKELGKVNYPYKWGWKFQVICKIMGWKVARKLQFYYYSKRYNI
ncbi:glycosyltransferase family 2 protein [Pontibacter pamirensis]|uniref:glycosyltransferase family 2 protein n=1 Tax=Pontibacter pamirensis TaxID=2562824 RepID=UPI00138A2362|nr:glycosyltransferase family A protein [Pontibacter pamirensis]